MCSKCSVIVYFRCAVFCKCVVKIPFLSSMLDLQCQIVMPLKIPVKNSGYLMIVQEELLVLYVQATDYRH